MAKVTVYIPSHNYGQYVERAVESVFRQTMTDWELILINDGSTDNTSEILKRYENRPNVRILEQQKKGLSITNNIAMRLSNAPYLIRLDADDYLDENALLVMSHILDEKKEVGLVYPDYYVVDEDGEMIELVRRKKIGEEVNLLDLPAHGACTMIRKECLLALGGYEETITCQDGYDLWLRFLESFQPYNVNVPLFYYRQHAGSLTKNAQKILDTRAQIKRSFVENHKNGKIPKVLGIVPVIARSPTFPDHPFADVNDKPLLWYTLKQAAESPVLDRVVLTSNDDKVLEYGGSSFPKVATLKRPERLSSTASGIGQTVRHVLGQLKEKDGYVPDAVMVLYINAPLRRPIHIQKAIDTMTIFNVDSVVSVAEELSYCYQHGLEGLEPVQKQRDLRLEKKSIYKETGAVLLARTASIDDTHFIGGRVGHITLLPEESIRIKTDFDLWLVRKIVSEWLPKNKDS